MKLSQRDIILLELADNVGCWVQQFRMASRRNKYGWIGSQGDKRCREFFEPGETTAEVKFQNSTYHLERGEKDGYAIIRVVRIEKPVYQLTT